ncbi:MAG: 5-methyltetrahydrofolate--homocysteine methyltransferase [Candidatus Syntrophonatronum acetioxidans]|uniref:Methionine synthase n=1 Tax=Candidatus Syntrophonatronum acetioxidans TaxID=1795816 RepID=A0A424YH96_9FIRM|nr:MAG: 5-methyltetrahydrofolate--homocysteine methyltransferase [Candidatus Syntrophonatronum acetioxidans]
MGSKMGDLIDLKHPVLLDGGMGTILQKLLPHYKGCPEYLNLDKPEVIIETHRDYIKAGSHIIQTNTFGGNRVKLAGYNLQDQVEKINYQGVRLARQAAEGGALVSASLGPTGRFMEPFGDLSFQEAYEIFAEQARAFSRAGADLITIETMSDLGEVKAAVIAVKENTSLPLICQMTFTETGRTIAGTDPATFVHVVEALEVDALGANCSGGPKELLPVLEEMSRITNFPLSVQPNAGLPQLVAGETVFNLSKEEFARYGEKFLSLGVNLLGGCCGTDPEFIKTLKEKVSGKVPQKRNNPEYTVLTSRERSIYIGRGFEPAYVGDKINPTGRPLIARDLKTGKMENVCREAKEQWEAGTPILDVNVGMAGINQAEAMYKAIQGIQRVVDCSVAVDSTTPQVVEAGLQAFIGKPLVNSVNGEDKSLEALLPLAKKYGAALLGLVIDEKGIPATARERLKIAEKIVERALEYGIKRKDIFIDCLVLTASVHQEMVLESLETIRLVKEKLQVNALLGATNISHGMPCREILNATYIAMGYGAGMDMPILDPFDIRIREVIDVFRVFNGSDSYARDYIQKYGGKKVPYFYQGEKEGKLRKGEESGETIFSKIKKGVVNGEKEIITSLVEKALEGKASPGEIMDQALIPGMEEVGEEYEKGEIFLPQLLLAAETVKGALKVLKPYLSDEPGRNKGRVVICTVEGDIHDIGKNIVAMIMENHGFEVVDLGRDVPSSRVIEAAREYEADIVALSALMTTTMNEMPRVIQGLDREGLEPFIMVGGAVVTADYAQEIGAHGFARDAQGALKEAERLMKEKRKSKK